MYKMSIISFGIGLSAMYASPMDRPLPAVKGISSVLNLAEGLSSKDFQEGVNTWLKAQDSMQNRNNPMQNVLPTLGNAEKLLQTVPMQEAFKKFFTMVQMPTENIVQNNPVLATAKDVSSKISLSEMMPSAIKTPISNSLFDTMGKVGTQMFGTFKNMFDVFRQGMLSDNNPLSSIAQRNPFFDAKNQGGIFDIMEKMGTQMFGTFKNVFERFTKDSNIQTWFDTVTDTIRKQSDTLAKNSIALGYGSVAEEANVISIGNKGLERRITHVANGEDSHDAANMSQLATAYNIDMALKGSIVSVKDGKGDVSVDLATLETNQGNANRNDIDTNTQKNKEQDVVLDNHEGRIDTNTKGIATNRNDIDTNTQKNKEQDVVLDNHEGRIDTNTEDIATNRNDIDTNTQKNKEQDAVIDNHEGRIATNTEGIATNRNDIDTNTQKNKEQDAVLDNHEGRIATNTSNIHTNRIHIDTNTRGIAMNRYNIYKNSQGIASNRYRIQKVEHRLRYVHVTDHSTAVGKGASGKGYASVAIGHGATVEKQATGAVAVGSGAQVTKEAENSVALGQSSVANQANTISVGNENLKRRIVNVADGIDDYDAVNMRQYHFLEDQVHVLDAKVNGLGAMTAAMSALVPNGRSSKQTQMSVGLGNYEGETALAAGIFHYVEDDILLNAALSHAADSGTAVRAGVTWGF